MKQQTLFKIMDIKISSYCEQEQKWPKSGNHILAQFDTDSIIVYQAFNEKISKELVKNQNYHSKSCIKIGLNLNRMTWIKTNFLWMMFRSGWAQKENQERILAIRLKRTGFDEILSKAVGPNRQSTKEDEVRLQWDPDHLPNGEKVAERRAIQLGIHGKMFEKLSHEFIINISDITDLVNAQHVNINKISKLQTPIEEIYQLENGQIRENIQLDS